MFCGAGGRARAGGEVGGVFARMGKVPRGGEGGAFGLPNLPVSSETVQDSKCSHRISELEAASRG